MKNYFNVCTTILQDSLPSKSGYVIPSIDRNPEPRIISNHCHRHELTHTEIDEIETVL